ncbi:MAG: hypothetical protein QM680_10655 [Luteolibacter sp.]
MSLARHKPVEQRKPRVQRNTPNALSSKGWTLSKAASYLGCDHGHLRRVLTGERHSKRLSARIADLPDLTQ